ncbi:hypothetical protein C0993_000266 [Termitomyces sp. T159_Od127]|nr:hypothetical protein C0993_000266 [Termitomyces sp. T159_Od127]
MPAFRNVKTCRSSERVWSKPIEYDGNGWEIPSQTDISLSIPTHHVMPSPHSSATSPSIASVDSDFEVLPAQKFKGKAKVTHLSDSEYVPRPKNAFILFRSYFYHTCGGSDQNQISVNAGKAWKALPDEQKKPFQLAADREKQEHQARFPHYTYAPGSKLGTVRRKHSAVKKKKTQTSTKKSLVNPPPLHCDSRTTRMNVIPVPVAILPPAMPYLAPPSPVIPTNVKEPTIDLANSEAVLKWDTVFASSSFETAFVPTSEIPPLELPPVKSERKWNKEMKGLIPPSSLRPPNFDISNEPFGFNPQPVSIDNILDTPGSSLHCDYDETLRQLLDSSDFYAFTSSPSGFDTWNVNSPRDSGPLELSYAGYPMKAEVIDEIWEGDLSVMNGDLVMGDDTNYKPSLFPSLAVGPFKTYTSFGDCEMDAFVDYGECDI